MLNIKMDICKLEFDCYLSFEQSVILPGSCKEVPCSSVLQVKCVQRHCVVSQSLAASAIGSLIERKCGRYWVTNFFEDFTYVYISQNMSL